MDNFVVSYEEGKDWLSTTVHLTHHELHVVLGLLLTVVFGLLLRRPLGSFVPLLIVFALELANETSDFMRYYLAGWPWEGRQTLIEVALTMGPPLALVLTARLWRRYAGR